VLSASLAVESSSVDVPEVSTFFFHDLKYGVYVRRFEGDHSGLGAGRVKNSSSTRKRSTSASVSSFSSKISSREYVCRIFSIVLQSCNFC